MSALTIAAVLGLAGSCQHVVAPMTIVKIAQHESGLDPARVNINRDGTRDEGLLQINNRNDAWLNLKDPFDPCQSIRAAADLLASYSLYNTGSTTKGITNGYAMAVQSVRFDPHESKPTPDPPVIPVFARPTAGRELFFASPITERK